MLCRDELRHRNPIRKPLFMHVCELSVSILPTVCPQEFFAHRLSLHLFYSLIIFLRQLYSYKNFIASKTSKSLKKLFRYAISHASVS